VQSGGPISGPYPAIAEELGYEGVEAARSAKRAARAGRRLMGQLGAWPWWGAVHWYGTTPGAALPRDWWTREVSAATLFMWRHNVTHRQWESHAAA
jgi:hypothetical protein